MKLTNKHKLSLPLAILFAHSDYDHDDRDNVISATALLKPVKSIALAIQNKDLKREMDLADNIPSVFGSAVHAFAEKGWSNRETLKFALDALGIAKEVQDRIVINPKDGEALPEDAIPFYIERRGERQVSGWTVRGKFDQCINGKLSDYKTCSVWSTIFDSNREDYILQGSIYRWIHQPIVTADNVSIEKIYTDWSASKARADRNYPQLRVGSSDYPLMSITDTEKWIIDRLHAIDTALKQKQDQMPLCTDEELWATPSKYKYYKKPGATKATKVYDNLGEAQGRLASEGCGEVKTFPGQVKRCGYCPVQPICDQSKGLIASGRLVI